MLFATDADVASEFINGIIPKSLVEETKKLEAEKSNVAQIPQKAE